MAGLFSDATRERIRVASDIVDVIGSYLPLKRAGANFVALCPFHKEKTPSFNVNPHRQIFHCFGCHKGGDVFTFVKEYENIDFPEAVRRLAERAKIPLEYEKSPGEQQSRHIKEQLLQIHEQIAQRWQNALDNEASGQVARDYLAKRGVSAEAVKLFRLGCAPDLWDDTVNWAKSKGYAPELAEKAGLILRKEGTDHYYDRFRGRLMFPICDEQGRVIGFSGRILSSGNEKTAKYINSPETPIFTKSKVLFGLDKAKRTILDVGCAVVCEGQLDTISCHARGVTHVVAPQGTALTGQHVRILQRYTNDIILCFDGDNAGRKASARGFDELIQLGVPFRVAEIPPPEDPDSFLKQAGVKAFLDLLVRAREFFDWYLDYLCQTHDPKTDRGRIAIIAEMGRVLSGRHLVLVDTYTQRSAMRLGVTPDAVRAEFRKLSRSKRPTPEAAEEPAEESPAPQPPPPHEYWLLKLVLRHEDLVGWTALHLDPEWVQHPLVKQIISRRLTMHSQETWLGLPNFLDECESPELQNLITEATAEERAIPNPAQQLADVALRLRNQFLDRRLATSLQRASLPEIAETERDNLLREQRDLRLLKRQPLSPEAGSISGSPATSS